MKRHMTHMELTQTRKLIASGVKEVAEIQKHVFCHADNIQHVIDTEPARIKAEKEAAKKGNAASRVNAIS